MKSRVEKESEREKVVESDRLEGMRVLYMCEEKKRGFNFVPLEEEISTSFIARLFAPSHRKGNVIIGIPFIRLRG